MTTTCSDTGVGISPAPRAACGGSARALFAQPSEPSIRADRPPREDHRGRIHPRGGGRAAGPPRTRTLRRPVRASDREPREHAGRRHAPSRRGTADPGDPRTHPAGWTSTGGTSPRRPAGRLDPVIGRDDEIGRPSRCSSRRTKNNPVLVGEPGVGKTAIVEGIAQRIVDGEVPEKLQDRRVVALDLPGWSRARNTAVSSRSGSRRDRGGRGAEDELIVFIDELHTVVGAGGGEGGAMDAGNMLKPALARGELHVVGATTLNEYRKTSRRTRRWSAGSSRSRWPSRSRTTIAILHGLRRTATRRTTRCATRTRRWRRRRAVRPLPHRPVPAGQGHRPDRPGEGTGPAAIAAPRAPDTRGRTADAALRRD